MKRSYPYTGPKSQAPGAQQQSYGQPPPPAGPAPPLPASGPPPPAYANYGYGSVPPGRHAAAPLNGAGAATPQHGQWNQQQWQQQQQQQPYYPQQPGAAAPYPPQPVQSGPYHGASHAASYVPHQSQQPPAQYSYQAQASPAQHQQPPAPPSYGYSPSAPQHQNVAVNSDNTQNWPGAYAAGNQSGPPSKKARYQTPAAPVPVPAYVPPVAAPMAPVGHYGQNAGNVPPQQPYAWQSGNATPAPHLSPQPTQGQQSNSGRIASGNGMNANAPGRGGFSAKNGRGGGAVNGPGRNGNRIGAQNRGNLSQGPSGPRAGLPANPSTARAQNGPAPAWGPHANIAGNMKPPGTAVGASRPGHSGSAIGASPQLGGGIQGGRRASTSSSVHSDKNSRRGVASSGSTSKPGFSSQNMIPINAPRGPNDARNKADKSNAGLLNTAANATRKGAIAAQNAAKSTAASRAGAADTAAWSKDSNASHVASAKRAHTDFRILGLEIKELDWSWIAPQALAKDEKANDDVKIEDPDVKYDTDHPNDHLNEASTEDTAIADHTDGRKEDLTSQADDEQAADGDKPASTRGDDDQHDDGSGPENEDTHVKAEQDPTEIADPENGPAEYDEGHADADADGEVDEDAQGEADADADADTGAHVVLQPEADGEEDASMSHADAETTSSNAQNSVAPTPEPSNELRNDAQESIDKPDQQVSKGAKFAKIMANLRESTKLRLCFAAMSNAVPERAPTGPKGEQVQEAAASGKGEPTVKTEDAGEGAESEPTLEEEEKTSGEAAAEKEQTDADVAEDTVALDVKEEETEKPSQEQLLQSAEVSIPETVEGDTGVQEQDASKQEANDQNDNVEASSLKGKRTRTTVEVAHQAKGPPQLSLNRIFLPFAANRKRLAIDAEAVKSVKIHRSEHWIEICINTSIPTSSTATRKKGEEYLVCNGTLLEKRGKGQENYTAVTRAEIASAWEAISSTPADLSDGEHLELPPFFRLDSSDTESLTLLVHLDSSAPLPEPTWLKKNDVTLLLVNLQRGSSTAITESGIVNHVWFGKIQIMDPDPPPSMSTFLYDWVKESFIGTTKERRKFVDDILCKPNLKIEPNEEKEKKRNIQITRNFIEIITRLNKGERIPSTSLPSNGWLVRSQEGRGGVITKNGGGGGGGSSSTWSGYFMLSLIDLVLEEKGGKEEVERIRRRVDEMCMELPRSVIFKAMDGCWRDVVDEGRRKKDSASGSGSGSGVGKGGGGGVKKQFGGRNGGAMGRGGGGVGGGFGKRKRV